MSRDEEANMLLTRIVEQRMPGQRVLLARLGSLTDDEREALRGTVAEELCEKGLGPNDEPNSYGMTLEDLIDWLGEK